MKYIDFYNYFNARVTFSLFDIKKVFPDFDNRRISEWKSKGYIKTVIRGRYIFANHKLSENDLFLIANRLIEPSYVSMESSLSHHGLIPEGVYTITSVTTSKTIDFDSPIGRFSYRKIKPSLSFGYAIVTFGGSEYKMADVEKTLLDYFYLNSSIKNEDVFLELRINKNELLSKLDFNKLKQYLSLFENKLLERRIGKFLRFIEKC